MNNGNDKLIELDEYLIREIDLLEKQIEILINNDDIKNKQYIDNNKIEINTLNRIRNKIAYITGDIR